MTEHNQRTPGHIARIMRRAAPIVLAVALLPCAIAQAAPSPIQRKAFSILLHTARGILSITDQQVTDGAKLAQQQLNQCSSALTAPISSPMVTKALSTELAVEYVATSLHPLYQLAATDDKRSETLPFRQQFKQRLAASAGMLNDVRTLNLCSDFTAWQTAGFAPTQEPSGTQLATTFANWQSPPIDDVLFLGLTPSQQAAVRPLEQRAATHAKELVDTTIRSLDTWIRQALGA